MGGRALQIAPPQGGGRGRPRERRHGLLGDDPGAVSGSPRNLGRPPRRGQGAVGVQGRPGDRALPRGRRGVRLARVLLETRQKGAEKGEGIWITNFQ